MISILVTSKKSKEPEQSRELLGLPFLRLGLSVTDQQQLIGYKIPSLKISMGLNVKRVIWVIIYDRFTEPIETGVEGGHRGTQTSYL